jgi:hypothetical protein
LQSLIPALGGAAASGGFDIGAALGNLVGGGVIGAIVTVVVNLIKNAMFIKSLIHYSSSVLEQAWITQSRELAIVLDMIADIIGRRPRTKGNCAAGTVSR